MIENLETWRTDRLETVCVGTVRREIADFFFEKFCCASLLNCKWHTRESWAIWSSVMLLERWRPPIRFYACTPPYWLLAQQVLHWLGGKRKRLVCPTHTLFSGSLPLFGHRLQRGAHTTGLSSTLCIVCTWKLITNARGTGKEECKHYNHSASNMSLVWVLDTLIAIDGVAVWTASRNCTEVQ